MATGFFSPPQENRANNRQPAIVQRVGFQTYSPKIACRFVGSAPRQTPRTNPEILLPGRHQVNRHDHRLLPESVWSFDTASAEKESASGCLYLRRDGLRIQPCGMGHQGGARQYSNALASLSLCGGSANCIPFAAFPVGIDNAVDHGHDCRARRSPRAPAPCD